MIRSLLFLLTCIVITLLSCGKSVKPVETPYPFLAGRVMEATDSSAIALANIILYNANTNAPETRTFSDANGFYSFNLDAGIFYLKVSAQGFQQSPPPGLDALPFQMLTSDTTWKNVYLDSNTVTTTAGSISGTVKNPSGAGISGVLIVATNTAGTQCFSGTSGPNGFYIIYNVPPGTYTIQCYLAGYIQVTTSVTVTVTANVTSANNDITLQQTANATLSGQVTFLASQNATVDITLVHPITREAIPGLSTSNTTGNTYQLNAIPQGSYIVWATYRNDGYVMDPDRILKFGLPFVTVTSSVSSYIQDFEVTDAVIIYSPSNPADTVQPVLITTKQPTFAWEKYPSSKEYIIEVSNSHGTIIWGGADSSGIIQHTQIAAGESSAIFNFDGSATDSLRIGETYRWKIYADSDAQQNIQGLISMSEGLLGLFRVVAGTSMP